MASCSIFDGLIGSKHKHNYVETVIEPTCTEAGYTLKKCECGDEKKEKEVAALGHDYSATFTVDKNATCTEQGIKSRHCTRCSAKTGETSIEPLGHNYSANWVTDVKAQCAADGKESRHCSRCDSRVDERALPRLGHDFADTYTVDVRATCEKDGSESKHCLRCTAVTETRSIAKLGHDYSSILTIDSNPTCTQDGQKSRHCSRCSSKIDIVNITKLGHDFSSTVVIDKESTCTEDGQSSRHCSRCNEKTDVKVIERLGHDIVSQQVVEPTCLEQGYTQHNCSRCHGYKDNIVSALGHDMDGGKCSRCNYVDPSYFYAVQLKDSPKTLVTDERLALKFVLSNNLRNEMAFNTDKYLTIKLQFEVKCEKAWGVGEVCVATTERRANAQYCDGASDIQLNAKTYTKFTYVLRMPVSKVGDSLYFVFDTPWVAIGVNTKYFIQNVSMTVNVTD